MLKLLVGSSEGKQMLYTIIGYANGMVAVYHFDNKLIKVKDLKTDCKEPAKDIIGDSNLLGVVHGRTVEFYSSTPGLNKIRTCNMTDILCSCHLGSKLYISTNHAFNLFERETLLK
jgi:hypothetical protein